MSSILLVLGSINIDLTVLSDEIPKAGETVIGKSFNQYPGGKGANQAVCAAKLKSEVCFLGKVGNDAYGDFMLKEMALSGVDVSQIERSETSTGIASICVDSKGQNNIVVVPGANFKKTLDAK
jgi:ribokinase